MSVRFLSGVNIDSNTLFVDSTNNRVGIGTTSPSYKLDVATGNDNAIRILNSLGSNNNGLALAVGSGTPWLDFNGASFTIKYNTSPGSWNSGANSHLTILSGGNVGIGTTSPSSKLHISGSSAQLLIQGDNYSGIHQAYAWVTNTYFGARYDGTNEVYGATGRGAFKIVALHDADNDPQYLAFYGANAGTAGSTITWNTVGFAQDEDGNVGIGTTAPSEKLVVNASSGNNSIIYAATDTGQAGLRLLAGTGSTNRATRVDFLNGVASGTVPRWTLINDYNQNGTNDFRFVNGDQSTSVLTLLQGGNVGIGTTAPTDTLGYGKALDIQSSTGGAVYLRDSDATSVYGLLAYDGGATNRTTIGGIGASNYLRFVSEGNEAMRITSGNVGIGTTSPSYKLQVNGNAAFATNSGGLRIDSYDGDTAVIRPTVANGSILISDDSGTLDRGVEFLNGGGIVIKSLNTFDPLNVQSNGSSVLLAKSSGNVGIGTTSPFARLQVNSGNIGAYNNISTDGAQLYLGDTNFSNSSYWNSAPGIGAVYAPGTSVAGDLAFYVYTGAASSRTERMRIVTGGNVGIGTTAPTFKLDVQDGTNAIVRVLDTSTNNSLIMQAGTGAGMKITGYNYNTSTAVPLYISVDGANTIMQRSGGNVGIGTASPVSTNLNSSLTIYKSYNGDTASIPSVTAQNYYENQSSLYLFGRNSGLTIVGANGENNEIVFANASSKDYAKIGTANGTTSAGGDMYFRTGGNVEAMRITAGGNVGIGTSSPAEKLVVSDGGADGFEWVPSTGRWYRYNRSTSAYGGIYTEASEHTWSTAGGERMRITSAGNVGIGTTSPGYKLQVIGGQFGTYLKGGDLGSGSDILRLVNASDETTTLFRGDGNVSIGSALPLLTNAGRGNLTINGSSDAILTLGIGNDWKSYYYTNSNGVYIAAQGARFLSFETNSSERMVITSAGNVGIGTTAPTAGYKLDVAGSILSQVASGNTSIVVSTNNANGAMNAIAGSGLEIATDGTNQNIAFRTGVSTRMYITAAGNVGIGTTAPSNKLTVYQGGGVRVTGIASGDWIEMSGDLPGYSANQYPVIKSNGTIHFANNNKYSAFLEGANTYFGILDSTTTTRVFLATSGNTYFTGGNVGIGTASPTNILHVVGQPRFDSAGSSPASTAAAVIQDKYIGDNREVLTTPDIWLKVNINGTDYVIPAYE